MHTSYCLLHFFSLIVFFRNLLQMHRNFFPGFASQRVCVCVPINCIFATYEEAINWTDIIFALYFIHICAPFFARCTRSSRPFYSTSTLHFNTFTFITSKCILQSDRLIIIYPHASRQITILISMVNLLFTFFCSFILFSTYNPLPAMNSHLHRLTNRVRNLCLLKCLCIKNKGKKEGEKNRYNSHTQHTKWNYDTCLAHHTYVPKVNTHHTFGKKNQTKRNEYIFFLLAEYAGLKNSHCEEKIRSGK